jgi:hypothetical protein
MKGKDTKELKVGEDGHRSNGKLKVWKMNWAIYFLRCPNCNLS